MGCCLIVKTIDIAGFFTNFYKNTRTKNPECESVQDFYFLPLHYSLFTKNAFRILQDLALHFLLYSPPCLFNLTLGFSYDNIGLS